MSPLLEPNDIDKLVPKGAADNLQYVYDAITLTRHKIEGKVPLLGFTGAPVILKSFQLKSQESLVFKIVYSSGLS